MKTPLELAEDYCINTLGFVSKQDRGTYLAGFEAAHARIVALITEELQIIEANETFSAVVVRPSVGSAIKNLLEKIEQV